ncbi:MAG TPA: hypothetical protein VG944_08710 [Fimbriimonas sp.]|nr:hypothetical protein [Fimbriimonas sp.]
MAQVNLPLGKALELFYQIGNVPDPTNPLDAVNLETLNNAIAATILGIPFVFGDGVNAITATGLVISIPIPFACTITAVTVLGVASGSTVIDIQKCTYAQFDGGSTHPVSGDSICAAAKPTISSGTKYTDSTLTGWTTSVSAGDILALNINSISGFLALTLELTVVRS